MSDLEKRSRNNPRFSLRSYARLAGIAPSTLSRLMNGKRSFTDNIISRLSERLGIDLDIAEEAKHEVTHSEYFGPSKEDIFEFISNWYHFAILELVQMKEFKEDSAWIARLLGISSAEAQVALDRLQRVGLLKRVRGRLKPVRTSNSFGNDVTTSRARRTLQKELLLKAARGIDTIAFGIRDNSSTTFAVNAGLLPELVRLTNKYRADIARLAESSGNFNSVYQLCVALFPLTPVDEN